MADVREIEETGGNEFEAIVDGFREWNCPLKVVVEYDKPTDTMYIHEAHCLLNEKITRTCRISLSPRDNDEMIGILTKHQEKCLAEL